jgi:diguanylate cyclase (GGDEF)-like protein
MSLDISTLVLLTSTIFFSLGAQSIAFSFLQAGTRGARPWGSGMIGLGIGYAFIFLHPQLPGHALLYAGWVCIVVSVLLMYRALHRICGINDSQMLFSVTILGCAGAAWLCFTYVFPSPVLQIDTTSAAVSVITGRAAWDLWRYARASRHHVPALVVAGMLLVVAITPVVEILQRGTGTVDPGTMIEYGPPPVVFARVIIITLLSISVLWLEISRLYVVIEAQAARDELTGVANRRAIVALLQREFGRAKRESSHCSIALFDVDFFKRVNDTWGHPAGDEVLRWLTRMIGKSVRDYDTLGRYGGEEFLLVMPGAGPAIAVAIADRARLAVQNKACTVAGKEIPITISAGIATASAVDDLDALLHAADVALYSAKDSGRNRVVFAGTNYPGDTAAAGDRAIP